MPCKVHIIQLVNTLPEKRLPAPSEQNLASRMVTGCGEANGMGYWAATQVKGLDHEIIIMSTADIVHLAEGSNLATVNQWKGDESPTGYETVAPAKRFDQTFVKFDMGTRETQSVPFTGVCAIKPISGKMVQTTHWELQSVLIKLFKSLTDQLIVSLKRDNACGGKGQVVEQLGQGHIFRSERRVKDDNKTGLTTYPKNGRKVPLKGGMMGKLKSCSERGLMAASGGRWL